MARGYLYMLYPHSDGEFCGSDNLGGEIYRVNEMESVNKDVPVVSEDVEKQMLEATSLEAKEARQAIGSTAGGTLNTSSGEDYDNAYALRFKMIEWLGEKGISCDSEMLTLWVGWDGDGPKQNGKNIAIKFLPNDANGESQALWDLYCLSETEDGFIEKFKEWRTYARKQLAVDKAEN